MSRQRSLEQQRASFAWQCVADVRDKGKEYAEDYGQVARRAAADIQTNGLGQTLAFWRAKGSDKGHPKNRGANGHWKLQEHVSTWVMRQMKAGDKQDLMTWLMDEKTTTNDYRRATAESAAFLIWVRRFAEAELP